MVRHEHVQHLGRADSIKHLHAKLSFPLFAEMSRQCFAGRDAEAQTRTVERAAATVMFKQEVVDDGNAEEDRRTMLSKDSRNHVGRRLLAQADCGGTVQKRK